MPVGGKTFLIEGRGGPTTVAAVWARPVQLLYFSGITGEEYVARKVWREARLDSCPLHRDRECGLSRHGSYPRVKPAGIRVARYHCPLAGTTFSLLPDFLASRLSGELDEVERVVCQAEGARSVEAAADKLRPEVELPGAVRWLRRRLGSVRVALLALVTLMPDQLGSEPRLSSLRKHLGTEHALVMLRRLSEKQLADLPAPIGFCFSRRAAHTKRGQTACPEPGKLAPAAAEERPGTKT